MKHFPSLPMVYKLGSTRALAPYESTFPKTCTRCCVAAQSHTTQRTQATYGRVRTALGTSYKQQVCVHYQPHMHQSLVTRKQGRTLCNRNNAAAHGGGGQKDSMPICQQDACAC